MPRWNMAQCPYTCGQLIQLKRLFIITIYFLKDMKLGGRQFGGSLRKWGGAE